MLNSSIFSRIIFNKSLVGSGSKPCAFLLSVMEVLIKLETEIPGISTGYWKERNIPLWALSSGSNSNKSFPSKVILPPSTSYSSFPAITAESVLFPEPLGPMIACISPAFTSKFIPLRI